MIFLYIKIIKKLLFLSNIRNFTIPYSKLTLIRIELDPISGGFSWLLVPQCFAFALEQNFASFRQALATVSRSIYAFEQLAEFVDDG